HRFDALHPLFAWFCEHELSIKGKLGKLRTTLSPLHGMGRKAYQTEDGRKHIPYAASPQEVQKFKDHHPVGTKARLVMQLASDLWIRRSDIARLGPDNLIEED